MKANGYILIYNPISNEGHLDSWHVLFVKMLRQLDWGVIVVTHDPEGMIKKLKDKGLQKSENLIVLNAADSAPSALSVTRKFWARWNTLYDKARYQQHGPAMSTVFASAVIFLHRLINSLHGMYTNARKSQTTQASLQANEYKEVQSQNQNSAQSNVPSSTTIDPASFSNRVNQIVQVYPDKILAVLNMYVDAYPTDHANWSNFKFLKNIPWMGVCITPVESPNAGYYTLPSYKGTCFLDEAVCSKYQNLMPERHFEYLPDITETSLPEHSSARAVDIVKQAKGRKIVFLGGSIGKQKNLARWYDLIALADPQQWFFVQIGRINKNNLTPEDELALERIRAHHPENLLIRPEYLADERLFNEIISISDMIFAVYREFARSSNMLSKAAYFEKPILVSDRYLMGERVKQYKIGLAVAENDVSDIHQGLLALEHIPNINDNFRRYRQDFNEAVVQTKLQAFVQASIQC
jgi:hypothetical protein